MIELELQPVGTLEGSLAERPPTLESVVVVAVPKSARVRQRNSERQIPLYAAVVALSEDGRFRFDRLGAGEYELMFAGVGPAGGRDVIYEDVTVSSRQTAAVHTSFATGQRTLSIELSGKGGHVVRSAQLVVLPGTIKPLWSARALNAMIASENFDGRLRARWVNGAGTHTFRGLEPGQYSVCVAPVDGDFADPEFIAEMAASLSRVAIFCDPVEIEAGEGEISFAMQSPAMRILDE